jgi:hypothetical protein
MATKNKLALNKSEVEVIRPPENPNAKLWRYMDFAKFVSMLEYQGIFFTRSDCLGDPFEGSFTQVNAAARATYYNQLGLSQDSIKASSDFAKWIRMWTFVTCWHMNEHESAAMWKLYAEVDGSIAIQTTFRKLEKAIVKRKVKKQVVSKNTRYLDLFGSSIGVVRYIDYEKERISEGNVYYPFFHKRKSFQHEHEVRALFSKCPITESRIIW